MAFFIIKDYVSKIDSNSPRHRTGITKQGYGDSVYIIYQRIDSVYYKKEDIDSPERP